MDARRFIGKVGITAASLLVLLAAAVPSVAAPPRQGDAAPVVWDDEQAINVVTSPDGMTGHAYDTTLWTDGVFGALEPPLEIEANGKVIDAVPVREQQYTTVFVAIREAVSSGVSEIITTKLQVYGISATTPEWTLLHDSDYDGELSLQQSEAGIVLVGPQIFLCQVVSPGAVEVTEIAGPLPYWTYQLGDGTALQDFTYADLLGIRYSEQENNFVMALLNSMETELADVAPEVEEPPTEEPAVNVNTAILVGMSPATYLDAMLVSTPLDRVPGMEISGITVDGDFYCVQDGDCTTAEILVEGGGISVPVVVSAPGTYPLKGHIDETATVQVYLEPSEHATISAIRGLTVNYTNIVLPQVIYEGAEPDIEAGELYVQWNTLHPRRMEQFSQLSTSPVQMPIEDVSKVRKVMVTGAWDKPIYVYAYSLDNPPSILASAAMEIPGWITLRGRVYEPFFLKVVASEMDSEAVIDGIAAKITWQGIY